MTFLLNAVAGVVVLVMAMLFIATMVALITDR
jgi:hypothetical protein